jgi:hypothetical protein
MSFVILSQLQVPLQLPCYDFTLVTNSNFTSIPVIIHFLDKYGHIPV